MTKNVSVTMSSPSRFESSRPEMPHMSPEPNHATASTRRTGTPSVAVISRSSASARIAVPSLVTCRNTRRPGRDRDAEVRPMIWVQFTTPKPLGSV